MSTQGLVEEPLVEQAPTKRTGGFQNDYVNSVEHQIAQIKQFVKTTRKKIPSYSMTLAELSSLLLSEHDESTILLDTPIVWRTLRMLHDAQPFMKFCIGNSRRLNKGHDESGASTKPAMNDKEAIESDKQVKMVFERDRDTCMLTRVSGTDMVQIIPQPTTKSEADLLNDKIAIWNVLSMVPGHRTLLRYFCQPVTHRDFDLETVRDNLGKSWNMLTINAQIHRYLDGAYFGLKPIAILPSENDLDDEMELLRVEWRWLPRHLPSVLRSHKTGPDDVFAKRIPGKPISDWTVNLDSKDLVQVLKTQLRNPLGDAKDFVDGHPCVHLPSGRRIVSGMQFDIPVHEAEADMMRDALEVKWIALRIASICGAADDLDELRDGPDKDWLATLDAVEDAYQKEM